MGSTMASCVLLPFLGLFDALTGSENFYIPSARESRSIQETD
jgi:hypothetical protein